MIYRAIGVMSGSSLDGLDIVLSGFHENGGQWKYEIEAAVCYPYPEQWVEKLKHAASLSALRYQLLHTEYGHYIGERINHFIAENHLQFRVSLIASHGHTVFHDPSGKMTAQLGDGAAIAAQTQLPVVSDLRAMDVALGGQGAPIVPVGEKWLLNDYNFFLNIGGIANISYHAEKCIAFDICPANRVLNLLASETGNEFDEGGQSAAHGAVNNELLGQLNALEYYRQPYPKSLANEFGTDVVYHLIRNSGIGIPDALRTYVEHICVQIKNSLLNLISDSRLPAPDSRLLATGGGAFNTFLVEQLKKHLENLQIEVIVPDEKLVKFKEALIMAFIGVLRWRQEYNVLSSVTGASRDSIGGALWNGQEA